VKSTENEIGGHQFSRLYNLVARRVLLGRVPGSIPAALGFVVCAWMVSCPTSVRSSFHARKSPKIPDELLRDSVQRYHLARLTGRVTLRPNLFCVYLQFFFFLVQIRHLDSAWLVNRFCF
jgi:hypothetical protein